jgi:hypothetical protein
MEEAFRLLSTKLDPSNQPNTEWRYFMEKVVIVAVIALAAIVLTHMMTHPHHTLRLELVTLTKDVAQNAKDIAVLLKNLEALQP